MAGHNARPFFVLGFSCAVIRAPIAASNCQTPRGCGPIAGDHGRIIRLCQLRREIRQPVRFRSIVFARQITQAMHLQDTDRATWPGVKHPHAMHHP